MSSSNQSRPVEPAFDYQSLYAMQEADLGEFPGFVPLSDQSGNNNQYKR
jgi:hypothetical protein